MKRKRAHKKVSQLKKGTKGVRPRPDQEEAMERILELDPELDWSTAWRKGLDMFIAQSDIK